MYIIDETSGLGGPQLGKNGAAHMVVKNSVADPVQVAIVSGGTGGSGGGPGPSFTITQTVIAVTTIAQQFIASNVNRRYLQWMVIGTADVTIAPGSTGVTLGVGMIYQSSGTNKQGGSDAFPNVAPSNAFQCIAPATGSTLIIWEGV